MLHIVRLLKCVNQCLKNHHYFILFKDITTVHIQSIMHVYEIQHVILIHINRIELHMGIIISL